MTNAVAVAQYGGLGATKNRIINGAMQIDQRNAGSSVTIPTGTSTYVLDRWQVNKDTSGVVLTVQQGSSSNPAQFPSAQIFTASTGASVGAGDYLLFVQKIEGFNTADLAFGTASAATVTLSFWVRSSITGTYATYLSNSAVSRSYVSTYTINSANTWEQKTITIPGDQSGTWIGSTNGTGLRVGFDLGSGSNYSTTAGSWAAGNYTRTSGTVNWGATSGATFYITGVQLEKGSTATSFDYRPYGTELALCQRYFYKLVGGGSGNLFPSIGSGHCASATLAFVTISLPVTMRSSATASYNGAVSVNAGGVDYTVTSLGILYGYGSGQWVTLNASGGGMTTGRGCIAYCAASTNDWFQLSSEL